MSNIFIAKETFSTRIDGARVVVNKGVTRVRAGHPLLDLHPDGFEPIDEARVDYDVEQATKAPGEKRGVKASGAK